MRTLLPTPPATARAAKDDDLGGLTVTRLAQVGAPPPRAPLCRAAWTNPAAPDATVAAARGPLRARAAEMSALGGDGGDAGGSLQADVREQLLR